jgi:hypothetical protein
MISSIDRESDVSVYLTNEEVEKLSKGTLEGVLINTASPKRQGTLKISVSDTRKNDNGYGIGIGDKAYWGVQQGFHLDVFVGNEYYQMLKERGRIGTISRMKDGSHVSLYDISKVDGVDASVVRNLEFYRDNKEKLLADKTGIY